MKSVIGRLCVLAIVAWAGVATSQSLIGAERRQAENSREVAYLNWENVEEGRETGYKTEGDRETAALAYERASESAEKTEEAYEDGKATEFGGR